MNQFTMIKSFIFLLANGYLMLKCLLSCPWVRVSDTIWYFPKKPLRWNETNQYFLKVRHLLESLLYSSETTWQLDIIWILIFHGWLISLENTPVTIHREILHLYENQVTFLINDVFLDRCKYLSLTYSFVYINQKAVLWSGYLVLISITLMLSRTSEEEM